MGSQAKQRARISLPARSMAPESGWAPFWHGPMRQACPLLCKILVVKGAPLPYAFLLRHMRPRGRSLRRAG